MNNNDLRKAISLGRQADSFLISGRNGEAAGLYAEALKTSPNNHEFWHGMGLALECERIAGCATIV